MTTKHTTGPWESFTNEERGQFRIADSETAQKTIGWAYKAEDARLITAAPDLLAALEQCVRIMHNASVGVKNGELATARAAIAKAKGDQS